MIPQGNLYELIRNREARNMKQKADMEIHKMIQSISAIILSATSAHITMTDSLMTLLLFEGQRVIVELSTTFYTNVCRFYVLKQDRSTFYLYEQEGVRVNINGRRYLLDGASLRPFTPIAASIDKKWEAKPIFDIDSIMRVASDGRGKRIAGYVPKDVLPILYSLLIPDFRIILISEM